MKVIEKIKRFLADGPKAISYATGTLSTDNFFQPDNRDKSRLEKYRAIYEKAGIPAQAIDSYALFMLSAGYNLVSDDETAKTLVYEKLRDMQITKLWWLAITRALNYGDSFQEIIPYKNQPGISRLVHRWPGSFSIITDDRGDLVSYQQEINGRKIPLPPQSIVHLALLPSDNLYGVSLTGRAYDEIINDVRVTVGIATGIERHGTGKHHWTLGNEDNPSTTADVEAWKTKLQTLKSDSDIVTTHLYQCSQLDQTGISNAQQYSDTFLQRLCSAYGVPGELLGLRIGSTDATAVSRIDAFFRQIAAFQSVLAETYQPVIDQIVGKPGVVWLEFGDPSPRDEAERAAWITTLMKANPLDPFWPGEQWIRDQFGLPSEV